MQPKAQGGGSWGYKAAKERAEREGITVPPPVDPLPPEPGDVGADNLRPENTIGRFVMVSGWAGAKKEQEELGLVLGHIEGTTYTVLYRDGKNETDFGTEPKASWCPKARARAAREKAAAARAAAAGEKATAAREKAATATGDVPKFVKALHRYQMKRYPMPPAAVYLASRQAAAAAAGGGDNEAGGEDLPQPWDYLDMHNLGDLPDKFDPDAWVHVTKRKSNKTDHTKKTQVEVLPSYNVDDSSTHRRHHPMSAANLDITHRSAYWMLPLKTFISTNYHAQNWTYRDSLPGSNLRPAEIKDVRKFVPDLILVANCPDNQPLCPKVLLQDEPPTGGQLDTLDDTPWAADVGAFFNVEKGKSATDRSFRAVQCGDDSDPTGIFSLAKKNWGTTVEPRGEHRPDFCSCKCCHPPRPGKTLRPDKTLRPPVVKASGHFSITVSCLKRDIPDGWARAVIQFFRDPLRSLTFRAAVAFERGTRREYDHLQVRLRAAAARRRAAGRPATGTSPGTFPPPAPRGEGGGGGGLTPAPSSVFSMTRKRRKHSRHSRQGQKVFVTDPTDPECSFQIYADTRGLIQSTQEMSRRILRAIFPEWSADEPRRTTNDAKQVHVSCKALSNDQALHSYHGMLGYVCKERKNAHSQIWLLGDITHDDLAAAFHVHQMEGRKTEGHRYALTPSNIGTLLDKHELFEYGPGGLPPGDVIERVQSLMVETPVVVSHEWYTCGASAGTSAGLDLAKFTIALQHRKNPHLLTRADVAHLVFDQGFTEAHHYATPPTPPSPPPSSPRRRSPPRSSPEAESSTKSETSSSKLQATQAKPRKPRCLFIQEEASASGEDGDAEGSGSDRFESSGLDSRTDSQISREQPQTSIEREEGISLQNILPNSERRRP